MSTQFFLIDRKSATIHCLGKWQLSKLLKLKKDIANLELPAEVHIFEGSAIKSMDSAGALVLQQFIAGLMQKGQKIVLRAFSPQHLTLLNLAEELPADWQRVPVSARPSRLARLGNITVQKIKDFIEFLSFIGELAIISLRLFTHPARIPWRSCISVMETTGVDALFIIGLLSFLIGVVLAYQMGLQLKNYGANIYIVDLLGLSILREFSPLITAILVAGRSGSAFTAQLGTMKIREEIDALRTMGIAPAEIIILPKLLALFLTIPLLTIWSSCFGIMGGMLISKTMLNVGYGDFIHRFYEAVSVKYYFTGLIKSPVFGLVIAAIGCYQGMKVNGSAVSVGERTTISVVQSIFFIIVIDAFFSILFSWLGI